MTQFAFSAGQSVILAPSKQLAFAGGKYTIVAALPRTNERRQYRVKGESENFERVLDEVHLTSATLV
jgi:hypothetical protein